MKDSFPRAPRRSKHTISIQLGDLSKGMASQCSASLELLEARPELQQLEGLLRDQLGIRALVPTSMCMLRDEVRRSTDTV